MQHQKHTQRLQPQEYNMSQVKQYHKCDTKIKLVFKLAHFWQPASQANKLTAGKIQPTCARLSHVTAAELDTLDGSAS